MTDCKPGDLVRHKTGGPTMCVKCGDDSKVPPGYVICTWFDPVPEGVISLAYNTGPHEHSFAMAELVSL